MKLNTNEILFLLSATAAKAAGLKVKPHLSTTESNEVLLAQNIERRLNYERLPEEFWPCVVDTDCVLFGLDDNAQKIVDFAMNLPNAQIAVVVPRFSDVPRASLEVGRCIHSAFSRACGYYRFDLENGSCIRFLAADKPNDTRGYHFDAIVVDEHTMYNKV